MNYKYCVLFDVDNLKFDFTNLQYFDLSFDDSNDCIIGDYLDADNTLIAIICPTSYMFKASDIFHYYKDIYNKVNLFYD